MHTISFEHSGSTSTVAFNHGRARSFTALAEAFEISASDIARTCLLPAGEVDRAWANLTMVQQAGLELRLEPDGSDFLLFISDVEGGSSTSTGVTTLAEAFAFAAYWAFEMFD